MRFEILGEPAYTALRIHLEEGESVTAEAGAMMALEGMWGWRPTRPAAS